jgi:hypothetical protein
MNANELELTVPLSTEAPRQVRHARAVRQPDRAVPARRCAPVLLGTGRQCRPALGPAGWRPDHGQPQAGVRHDPR